MVLGDLVFEIDDHGSRKRPSPWESRFQPFAAARGRLTSTRDSGSSGRILLARNIMELRIHAGGSIVFWFEIVQPDRLVAIDIAPTGDSSLFLRYIASRGLHGRIETYWETSLAGSHRLEQIAASDVSGPLDLRV